MREAEPLCAENFGLKDIARSSRRGINFLGELIMYYRPSYGMVEFMLFAFR